MREYASKPAATPGRGEKPEPHAAVPGRDLRSFDEILAASTVGDVPADMRGRFEAAHRVDLAGVRVHHAPELAEHGIRGLSRGPQIAVADLADHEALEHELGHVVDAAGAGGAAANAAIDGLELADDPAREARADQLAAQAKRPPPLPHEAAPKPSRAPVAGGAALPKLTNRANIAKSGGGHFAWAAHKTKATAKHGGGFEADGLGAVLATSVQLACTFSSQHGQLSALEAITPPQFVDPARTPLPEPPSHYAGHRGCYVLPSAMLGDSIPDNLLYLPKTALAEFAAIQAQMIDLAQKGPGKLSVKTVFGADGLANGVTLVYEALDRVSGAAVFQLVWKPAPNPDRSKWGTDASAKPVSTGAAPVSAEWKTHIEWSKPTADGDGVKVVADKLGPDHPLGSTPSDATADARVRKLFTAAGQQEPYIAGHLLNDHLGGPGDLAANLTPIPKKANGQMTASIEKPAKDIVNTERGWIRYEVEVTHLTDPADPTLSYPAKLAAKMEVYDATGARKNPTTSTIDIDPPSKFKAHTAAAPKAAGKLAGAALQSSPKMIDEVILSHENDLRPFLRDGAELFALTMGSELATNVPDGKLAVAWSKILQGLRLYEVTALPNLNMLATVTSALEKWQTDPSAIAYLGNVRVGTLRAGLMQCFLDARVFAVAANQFLQQANAVVKKDIRPSDLFRNAQALKLADLFIQGVPDNVTLLQAMMSQQQAAIPFRNHERQTAKDSADTATEIKENKVRDEFRAQPKPAQPTFPSSPVRVYQEYGSSVQDLSTVAMFGAQHESARMKKALDKLVELARTDGAAVCTLLRDDALLKTSARLQAVLTQVAELIVAAKSAPGALAVKIDVLKQTWGDSLEALATKEPKIAVRLFELLKVT